MVRARAGPARTPEHLYGRTGGRTSHCGRWLPAASARWAAALALARAGIDVQVYEQAQQLTEASADVSLAPNGLRMLKRLGVGEGIGRVAARHLPAQLLLSGGLPARHQPHQ